jgi:predicted Zn-dependent peptidase
MKSYSVNYKLRKKGLVYGIDFSVSESIESYGFELDISSQNDKYNEIYAYTLSGIRDLTVNGITESQFINARKDFSESFEDKTDSSDSIIGWYLQDYLMDESLTSPKEFSKKCFI